MALCLILGIERLDSVLSIPVHPIILTEGRMGRSNSGTPTGLLSEQRYRPQQGSGEVGRCIQAPEALLTPLVGKMTRRKVNR